MRQWPTLQFNIHDIRIEFQNGKIQHLEFDPDLITNGRDLRNFAFPNSDYWEAVSITPGRWSYPIPIITWSWKDNPSKVAMGRFINGIQHICHCSMGEIISRVKRGLCQVPVDGIERLLAKIKKGRVIHMGDALYNKRLDAG